VKLKPQAFRLQPLARPVFRITHKVARDFSARSIFSPSPMSSPPSMSSPPLISMPARRFALLFVIGLLVTASSCGKVGPPVPPARLTERTAELTAIQRGPSVLLQWPAPALVQNKSSRSYIARVDIYRLDEQRGEEPVLDADDYEAEAQVIGFLDRAAIEAQVKSLGRLQFADAINVSGAGTLATRRLRYAVRYLNARDQAAAFSNTVAIEPAPAISSPPFALRAEAPAQDVINISWSAPDANVDGSRPASIVGYNVYRRNRKRETGGRQINSEPVTETRFTDREFQYQAEYAYFVRALSQGANGIIESADSEPVTITPVDEFAPSAPEPVSIASANGTISLFWPTSPEPDVIGYNIYRSDSARSPDKDWVKLTAQPVTAVTYRDERVVIDNLYAYRVTAVDRFGNESKPSRAVSETAHP
jgi:hypothetical protein